LADGGLTVEKSSHFRVAVLRARGRNCDSVSPAAADGCGVQWAEHRPPHCIRYSALPALVAAWSERTSTSQRRAGRSQHTPVMIPVSPSSNEQIEPMTLGSMRRLGARSLAVSCRTCHRETVINADHWPGQMRVPSFWSRMMCGNCGTAGADARPNWRE
jgi:hypothetical protein